MKETSHPLPLRYEHVIWKVKILIPMRWIKVNKDKDNSKKGYTLHGMNLTLRDIRSQKERGSHYVLSWDGNYNTNYHKEGF